MRIFNYVLLILLSACDKEPCVLTGPQILQDGDVLENCHVDGEIWMVGKEIVIRNVTVNATGYDYGILIRDGSSKIRIDEVKVWGAKQAGISSRSWPESSSP